MRETDNWQTPKWLWPLFTHLKDMTPLYSEKDCLNEEWITQSYSNPPYSDPLRFALKAIEQHKKHGTFIVLLLPADTSTAYWRELNSAGAHFLYFGQRLQNA